ncbi:MAG: hypothetical protein Q9O74_03060 [Planctomycetota bacterium]|nr:hypothetical protein [Planctomycetota bacterium]
MGIPLAVGCRLVLTDVPPLLVYPADRAAYARLCRLLTLGKRRAPKGECHLSLVDLVEHQAGLLCIVDDAEPTPHSPGRIEMLRTLCEVFNDDRLSLAVAHTCSGDDRERIDRAAAVGGALGIPLVATNRVVYHEPGRRALQDVVTCIRHGCTLDAAGFRLDANAERHLKPPGEMARLFADRPGAIARTVEIAERATAFSLDQLRYQYPSESCPRGMDPTAYLAQLAAEGAATRYPEGVPDLTRKALDYELALIAELGYEPYFLTCYDIVRFACSRGILCQGRGGVYAR